MPAMMVWLVSASVLHPEGGVLLGQLHQAFAQAVLIDLGLGLDGHRDHRFGEVHGLQDDRVVGAAQRVAGGGGLEAHGGGDVAGVDLVRSSRWLACICRMRPTRSFLSLVEFIT